MQQASQGFGDGDAGAAAIGDDQRQGGQDGEDELDPPGDVEDVVSKPQERGAGYGGEGGIVIHQPRLARAPPQAAAVVGVLEEGDGHQEDRGGGEAQGFRDGDGAAGGAWVEKNNDGEGK